MIWRCVFHRCASRRLLVPRRFVQTAASSGEALKLQLESDAFTRRASRFQLALSLLKVGIPFVCYFGGLSVLWCLTGAENNIIEDHLKGDRTKNDSATFQVVQRITQESAKFSKPAPSGNKAADTSTLVNAQLQATLNSFLASQDSTHCLLVTGPRGSGKSFTVDSVLQNAANNNNGLRIVYVKGESIRRVQDLVRALERALNVTDRSFMARALHYLTLGIRPEPLAPLDRFIYLMDKIDSVAHSQASQPLKFVFVIDDFEELVSPADPDLKTALHFLVRRLKEWGTNAMVSPIVVSSVRDAEQHFYGSQANSIVSIHVGSLGDKNEMHEYVERKLRAMFPGTDEAVIIKCTTTILDTVGLRIADLRLACQLLSGCNTKKLQSEAERLGKRLTTFEKRRLKAFVRSLDQDDRVAVCAALHVLSGTADCKVSQTRAWSTIVREGLELLVDRGFVVEDDEECDERAGTGDRYGAASKPIGTAIQSLRYMWQQPPWWRRWWLW